MFGDPPLVAALLLAQRGWAVFPCQETDGPRAKSPYTAHGFKDATRDPDCAARAGPKPHYCRVVNATPSSDGWLCSSLERPPATPRDRQVAIRARTQLLAPSRRTGRT